MATRKRASAGRHDIAPHFADGNTGRASDGANRNQLLNALTSESYASLEPHLEFLEFGSGHIIYEPSAKIDYLYFPDDYVSSLVRRMEDGSGVEVGTIGYEGVVGISAVLGAVSMPTQCLVQIPGAGRRIETAALLSATRSGALMSKDGRTFEALLHLYSQAFFEQVAQSAACNRMHSLEQRCARWLLMTHDRTVGDELALTQEFLSYMLGVRRAGVTEAAGALQREGLITYRHGRIRIRDRAGLEASACECYRVGVLAYALLLNLPYPA